MSQEIYNKLLADSPLPPPPPPLPPRPTKPKASGPLAKLLVIAAVMLALLVPLQMIDGLVRERQAQSRSVVQEIAESASGAQRLRGPLLVVPYRERKVVAEEVVVQQDGKANTVVRNKELFEDHELVLQPATLQVTGAVKTDTLYRGLYQALTFTSQTKLTGTFELALVDLARDPSVTIGEVRLAVGVADPRGIRNTPRLRWRTTDVEFLPETGVGKLGRGIHAPIPLSQLGTSGTATFSLDLELFGTEALSFSPVGKDTRVQVQANWPHPSFFGRALPSHREVRDTGFSADWHSTWLNATGGRIARDAVDDDPEFGVRFIQPVDQYLQTDRAMKYAILFVVLTFAGFFLFEVLRRLRVHPMQYSLVGAALAMFYLLLVALSEHLEFAVAYAIASAACVGLIGFYVAHVLQHWLRGLGFAGLLGLLYGTLYGLLQSEDNALLLGAGLLFAALAAVMVLTRRLDWYNLAAPAVEAP
ncbi:MAG: cell envelope integrity protein CreD [Deltaproteobacteria bacterium]|nr:cell envelope integrity protein CreD [Deltaproteobacteria bacterium]